jgi:hypothetical protein
MRIDVTPNDELETKHPGQGPENEKSEARTYYYRILPVVRARVHACVGSYRVMLARCYAVYGTVYRSAPGPTLYASTAVYTLHSSIEDIRSL